MMAVLRRRAAVHKRSVIHFDPGTDAEWMTCWVEHDDQPVVSVRAGNQASTRQAGAAGPRASTRLLASSTPDSSGPPPSALTISAWEYAMRASKRRERGS
jgi:hypothetical protein